MVLPLIDFNCQNMCKFIYKLSEHATTAVIMHGLWRTTMSTMKNFSNRSSTWSTQTSVNLPWVLCTVCSPFPRFSNPPRSAHVHWQKTMTWFRPRTPQNICHLLPLCYPSPTSHSPHSMSGRQRILITLSLGFSLTSPSKDWEFLQSSGQYHKYLQDFVEAEAIKFLLHCLFVLVFKVPYIYTYKWDYITYFNPKDMRTK